MNELQQIRRQSRALYERATQRIPGGVNSPVRAFKAVGGDPLFIQEAEGPFVIDADGNRFEIAAIDDLDPASRQLIEGQI